MQNRFRFCGGATGLWSVRDIRAIRGESLEMTSHLDILNGDDASPPHTRWELQGLTSNVRYATRSEVNQLQAIQPGLGRAEATCAALIPIRKSAEWWNLAQDERRAIFEETSQHTAIGIDYLPAIARRLHHCRDLGEPFDFLTWFEFAPEHRDAFDELLYRLRATKEWGFVEREVDLRLIRA